MNIRVTFLVALSLACVAGSAWAGQPDPEPAVQYQPVTTFRFDPEDVEGGVTSPDGVVETARTAARLPSLIQVRADFRRELLQTADDL